MKRKILMILLLLLFTTTGCFKNSTDNAINDLGKKYKNLKAYHVEGELEIVNNEDTFNYDVDVIFQKDDKYRVSLKNKNNNHEQIILKNEDGVYVLTPSLNKSFKFQSNWPYNNSQVYLIKSILDDIKNDKEKTIIESDDSFKITTNVNYPNNRKLVKQMVTIDKSSNLKEVKVMDESDIVQMKMTFTSIDLSPSIKSDTFLLESIIKSSDSNNSTNNTETDEKADDKVQDQQEQTTETSTIEDIIYPLYIPSGTKLENQERVETSTGERIIMTFGGEKSFLLVEETVTIPEELEIIPTFGEPCILSDTVASLTDTSITWTSNNIDYYIVSDVMSQDELLEIARSVSAIPTMK